MPAAVQVSVGIGSVPMTPSRPPPYEIEPCPATVAVHRTGTAVRVEVAGDIDVVTAGILRESLDRATADRPAHLVVDMSRVTFVGSAGIDALAAAQQAVGSLVLVGANDQIRRILIKFGVLGDPAAG